MVTFLTNCELHVMIRWNLSGPFFASSVVSQVSHLFILFINNVTDQLKVANIIVFVEDIKIVYKIQFVIKSLQQKDLDAIACLSTLNRLKLNCNKC